MTPKININGVVREMTAEEAAQLDSVPPPEETTEDRLTDAESVADMAFVNSELALALLEEWEDDTYAV